jgi:hypothetical protein
MALALQKLRRAGALALLAVIACAPVGAPARAAEGPPPQPPAQAARLHAPSARAGGDGADDGMPGIIPICCGLLLTAIAVYRHRGLPSSGH